MAVERFKYFLLPLLIVSFVAAPVLFLFPQETDAQAATAGCAASYIGSLLGFGGGTAAATTVGAGTAIANGATSVPVSEKYLDLQLTVLNTSNASIAGSSGSTSFYDCILKPIVEAMAARMLANITNNLVNWIQNGFNGNPAFVTNMGDFLSNSADQAIGQFIQNDPTLSLLCSPFSAQIRIALAVNFSTQQYQGCTLSQIGKNISDFGNTFDSWNQWLQVTTVPANNQFGAYTIEAGFLSDTINAKLTNANNEVNRNGGFLDMKVCDNPAGADPNSSACIHSHTGTPGEVISSALAGKYESEFNTIGVATDLNQIIGALVDELVSTTITGPNGLLGSGTPSAPISANADLSALAAQQSASNAAVIADLNGQVATATSQSFAAVNQPNGSTTSAVFGSPSLPSAVGNPINLTEYSSYLSGSFAYSVGTTLSAAPSENLQAVVTIKSLGGTESTVAPITALNSGYALYLINQEGQKILVDGNSDGSQLLQNGILAFPLSNPTDVAGFEFDTNPATLSQVVYRSSVLNPNNYELDINIEDASGNILATNTAYFQVQ